MNGYSTELVRPARRELERLPGKVIGRVLQAIHDLQDNPRPRGCKKLHGEEAAYRIRVGEHRVVYEVDDTNRSVLILAFGTGRMRIDVDPRQD